MSAGHRIEAWAATDTGQVREENQDSYLLSEELGLFVVADGMGGSIRGDVASGLACNAMQEAISRGREILRAHAKAPSDEHANAVEQLLKDAVHQACAEIYRAAGAIAEDGGQMGTTLDAVLISGKQAFTAHVGDSRIWLIRTGESRPLTRDHTLTEEKVRRGIISREQALVDKQRNVVTRALGVFESVLIDTLRLNLQPGDRLLLGTDGLYRYVDEAEFPTWIKSTKGQLTVETLVGLANQRGGRDNITALLINVDSPGETASHDLSEDHLAALRRCELFAFCTWHELAQVAATCRVRDLPPGATIYREGDQGLECYIIHSGKVRLLRGSRPLAELGPSNHFGEMSLIDAHQRENTAQTLTPVRLLVLSRNDFQQLLRHDSALAVNVSWRLLLHLSKTVRATLRMLSNLPGRHQS